MSDSLTQAEDERDDIVDVQHLIERYGDRGRRGSCLSIVPISFGERTVREHKTHDGLLSAGMNGDVPILIWISAAGNLGQFFSLGFRMIGGDKVPVRGKNQPGVRVSLP